MFNLLFLVVPADQKSEITSPYMDQSTIVAVEQNSKLYVKEDN